jgi:hypothetical protein
MSIIETVKAAGNVVLEVVKANPALAAAAVVGGGVVGYGGYRGWKAFKNRAPKAPVAPAATLAAGEAPVELKPIEVDPVVALLTMSREQAEQADLLNEWSVALKAKLRAAQK